jgi:hypothetical protein
MPTTGSDADIVLTSSNGQTVQGLNILVRDGVPQYSAHRLPVLPSVNDKVRQSSWHNGFGGFLYRNADPNRYGYSDGVDLRFANGAQLVNQFEDRLDFLIRNMDAEDNTVTMWTANDVVANNGHGAAGGSAAISSVSVTSSDEPREGLLHFKVTSGTTANSGVYQSLTNPAVYALGGSITFTFRVYVKAGATSVEAFIWEDYGGGNDIITTIAHSGDGTYQLLSVTKEISSASTSYIEVGVRDTSASNLTFHIDEGWIELEDGLIPAAMAEYAGAIYLIAGNAICVWNETNDVWDAVYIDADEPYTDLAVHGSFIYAAYGSGYTYSNDTSGARTTWTDVVSTDADFFQQALDSDGVLRLYRVSLPNTIKVDDQTFGTAIGSSDWGESYRVGESDKNITQLYSAFDTIIVGREDGLWYYYPPDDKFRSATEMFKLNQHSTNFDRGIEYIDGFFYTTTTRLGLVRITFRDGNVIFDPVAPRYQAPMYDGYGGRIRAIVHDGIWLYGLQDTGASDTSASKVVNLLAGRWEETPSGTRFIWHTLKSLSIGDIRGMFVESDFLWIFGRFAIDGSNSSMRMYRMALPTQHDNMMRDATIKLETSGTFVTEWIDFGDQGWDDDDKAMIRLRVIVDNANSDRTIDVGMQGVDPASSASFQSSRFPESSTYTDLDISGGAENAITDSNDFIFATGTKAKRVRFQFTLVSNVSTNGPILRSFRLESAAHPDRYWEWDFTARLGTASRGPNRAISSDTAENIMTVLESTLDADDAPLGMVDVDGQTYTAMISSIDKLLVPKSGRPSYDATTGEQLERAVRIVLKQTLTT